MTLTLAELAPHDPITVSVASSTPFFTSTRSDLSASVTFTQTTATNITCSGSFTTSIGIFFTGSSGVYPQVVQGLAIRGVTGSTYDLGLLNNAGSIALGISTGSINILYFGSFTASSDRRLKKNIKPIKNALNKLCTLSCNVFDWNELAIHHDHSVRQVGVIAQEVQKIMPEVVIEIDGYLSVDYGKLSVLAFAAIQELSKKVNLLELKLSSIDK
jgi:hypothetical protein